VPSLRLRFCVWAAICCERSSYIDLFFKLVCFAAPHAAAMSFMWFDDCGFARFRARLVGINSPSFLSFSPFKSSLVLANAAKPPFPSVYMAKRSFQARLCLSAHGIARLRRYNLNRARGCFLPLVVPPLFRFPVQMSNRLGESKEAPYDQLVFQTERLAFSRCHIFHRMHRRAGSTFKWTTLSTHETQ
jgi:hypothetical protein